MSKISPQRLARLARLLQRPPAQPPPPPPPAGLLDPIAGPVVLQRVRRVRTLPGAAAPLAAKAFDFRG